MFSAVHIYALSISFTLSIPWNRTHSCPSLRTFLAYPHLTYRTEYSFLTSNKVVMLIKNRTRFSAEYLCAACYRHWMATHFGAAPYLWGDHHQSPPHNSSRLLKAFPKDDKMYWWVLYVPAHGRESGLDDLKGPFQCKPCYDSNDLPDSLCSLICLHLPLIPHVPMWHEIFLHHVGTAFSYEEPFCC